MSIRVLESALDPVQCDDCIALLGQSEDVVRQSHVRVRKDVKLPAAVHEALTASVGDMVIDRIAHVYGSGPRSGDVKPHVDAPLPMLGGLSTHTVLVYLNSCDGGETSFPESGDCVQPVLGRVVVFPAIKHCATTPVSIKYCMVIRARKC